MTAVWIVGGTLGLLMAMAASRRAVHHAAAIAFGSRLPPFVIGIGLLAIGTDLPEIANSIIASLRGQGDLNVSDSIGSSVTQMTLIFGLLPFAAGAFAVGRRRARIVGSAIVLALGLGLVLVADGRLSRIDGGLLVGAWLLSSGLTWYFVGPSSEPELQVPALKRRYHILRAVGALALVAVGATVAIEALIRIAELVNVPVYILGFLGASLGTSLPELLVDVTALRAGQRDLAVGGVFGSSLVDATLSIGIGPLVMPTAITADLAVRGGLGALAAVGLVTLLLSLRRRHTRMTGFMMLLLYAGLYVLLLSAEWS